MAFLTILAFPIFIGALIPFYFSVVSSISDILYLTLSTYVFVFFFIVQVFSGNCQKLQFYPFISTLSLMPEIISFQHSKPAGGRSFFCAADSSTRFEVMTLGNPLLHVTAISANIRLPVNFVFLMFRSDWGLRVQTFNSQRISSCYVNSLLLTSCNITFKKDKFYSFLHSETLQLVRSWKRILNFQAAYSIVSRDHCTRVWIQWTTVATLYRCK